MVNPGNDATPPAAATFFTPPSTAFFAGDASSPMASCTMPEKLVAALPSASYEVTSTAGLIGSSRFASLGCTVNASVAAGPATTENGVLVAPVSWGADAARV